MAKDDALDSEVRRDLVRRRAFLDNLAANPTVTPCTNCYNCKIISLVHADSSGTRTILFAHHAKDVLSSFMKSALMYIDRWEEGRRVFDRDAFRRLGTQIACELRLGDQALVDYLASLLAEGKAHTSEPPIERRTLHGRAYVIARPLFFVDEAATAVLAKTVVAQPESSGCGHSMASTTRTPREIVHHELIPVDLSDGGGSGEACACSSACWPTASLRTAPQTSNVRRSRHLLLGPNYKGSPADLGDRL